MRVRRGVADQHLPLAKEASDQNPLCDHPQLGADGRPQPSQTDLPYLRCRTRPEFRMLKSLDCRSGRSLENTEHRERNLAPLAARRLTLASAGA